MTYRLPGNLPALMRAAGLTVVEIDGWETRERPPSKGDFAPVGVLNHHTGAYDGIGDPEDDLRYARWLFTVGRDDLPPPLCQASLSAEGVVYLGAAGRANHAGDARASGSVAAGDGNKLYVGIEWMLSGTQPIPPAMYAAGATLNAVLLRLLGSSVQAASCHYQTSHTGKWDIGDPRGVALGDHRVLNVPKFRDAVKAEKRRLAGAGAGDSTVLKIVHSSMQFGDTDAEMRHDIADLFGLRPDVLTGTEASGAKAKPMPALLREASEEHGYRFHKGPGSDCWVAVKREVAQEDWRTGVVPVIPANSGGSKHTAKGITWASWRHEDLGEVTQGVQHMLLRGRRPGDRNYHANREFAKAVGDFGRSRGRGEAVVFDNGDQNLWDQRADTYHGHPFTSGWDEVNRYEPTFPSGGTIDVVSSFDRDGRVKCLSIKSLSDKEFPQHHDHFPVVARYRVGHVR